MTNYCLTCTTNPNTCTSCQSGMILRNGSCTYCSSIVNNCQTCDQNTLACTSCY